MAGKWAYGRKISLQKNTRNIQHIIRGLPNLTAACRSLVNRPSKSDIRNLLVDNEMLKEIVSWTNKKITFMKETLFDSTNSSNCRSTNVVELKALIWLFVLFSITKSSHEDMLQLFYKDSSVDQSIFRITLLLIKVWNYSDCLRFDNSMTGEKQKKVNRTAAVPNIFNNFVSNCQKLFTVGNCVTRRDATSF